MRLKPLQAGCVALALAAGAISDAAAFGWLSRFVREAGEAGGSVALKAGKPGLGALDTAAAHVAALPKLSQETALAAHLTPEGHWKFANREGQVFTAGTPDELARAVPALAPDAPNGERLALYLSEETVFNGRAFLKDLPPDAALHIVSGTQAFKLRRTGGAADTVAAELRSGVVLNLSDRPMFDEALFRLTRPLNRANIRVLALEAGGPRRLPSVPRYDAATKSALVDQIDPTLLGDALGRLKGQTALVTGRIDGGVLAYRSSQGAEQTLDVARLVEAAAQADVNLVLLHTGAAHQPGGRNWLWQTVAVAGLDDALTRATFADFLSALGGGGELAVTAAPGPHGRVLLSALPTPAPHVSVPLTDTLSDWIGHVTGHVAVRAIAVHGRSQADQNELDARLVPGIPSAVQLAYVVGLVWGLLAWHVSRAWWARIWPPEARSDYAGRFGYLAARTARLLAFVLVFLPLAGAPALLWTGLTYVWGVLKLPFRAVSRLRGRAAPRRA